MWPTVYPYVADCISIMWPTVYPLCGRLYIHYVADAPRGLAGEINLLTYRQPRYGLLLATDNLATDDATPRY